MKCRKITFFLLFHSQARKLSKKQKNERKKIMWKTDFSTWYTDKMNHPERWKIFHFSGSGFSPLILYWILVFFSKDELAFFQCVLSFVKKQKKRKRRWDKTRVKKKRIAFDDLVPSCTASIANFFVVCILFFLLFFRFEAKRKIFCYH